MIRVTIKKGWYWSAGDKFHWVDDGYSKSGVGIEKGILQNNKEIEVEVNHTLYKLDCDKAREFINKYKSAQNMPGGTVLGIITSDLFQQV